MGQIGTVFTYFYAWSRFTASSLHVTSSYGYWNLCLPTVDRKDKN